MTSPTTRRTELFTDINDDGSDEPWVCWSQLSSAISVWSWMNIANASPSRRKTVADAAATFNTTPDIVRRALEEGRYCFVEGASPDPSKQLIEHDGE